MIHECKKSPHYRNLYKVWHGMVRRCTNPTDHAYNLYGAIGRTVCKEWMSSETFIMWALKNGYEPGLTLDRTDNEKGYSPDNCRWVPMVVQQNNRKNNRYVTFRGETHSLADWARILGIERHNLRNRLNRGWSVERAFTTPARAYGK